MSLPAIFNPVKTADGKIYADGGLLNNLPVDVVKAMGADIVIAVYLAVQPFDPKQSPSMFTMLGQSISVMIAANERRNMEAADILITINLAGYGALDYSSADEIADLGIEGAQKKRQMLLKLAADEPTWQQYVEQKAQRRVVKVPPPQFVVVEGTSPKTETRPRGVASAPAGAGSGYESARAQIDSDCRDGTLFNGQLRDG